MLTCVLIISLALLFDRLLGEPKKYHPLSMFGDFANYIEEKCYPTSMHYQKSGWYIVSGGVGFLICVLLPLVCIYTAYRLLPEYFQPVLAVIFLYLAIGMRSLEEHANAVFIPLQAGKLEQARAALGMIVSRDTHDLNEAQIATATIETVIENTHDSVIAPIFWFLVAGIWGVIAFRLVNTLDAMWGYKNHRYIYFGRISARADDVMGFLSARLTVLLFAIFNYKSLVSAHVFGRQWYSPNAGPVMAAGAEVLNVRLGGHAVYGGELKIRPQLGDGDVPQVSHIAKAIWLMKAATYGGLFILFVVGVIT